MMALDLYRRYWDDTAVTAALMVLKPGEDPDANVRGLQDVLAEIQGVLVRPNQALRDEALAVFDRAFAITGALQLLAAIVAFIGILERAAVAATRTRPRVRPDARGGPDRPPVRAAWSLLETGLMGVAAGLLAMPTGLALALVLIFIINRRSFGWTMTLQADPGIFLQALALAIIAALLAGVYPAWRMGRTAAADALPRGMKLEAGNCGSCVIHGTYKH